jgi:hypothetical protein
MLIILIGTMVMKMEMLKILDGKKWSDKVLLIYSPPH